MSVYLADSFSRKLPLNEEIKDNKRVKENRKDFVKGFEKGCKVSLIL